MAQPPRVRGIQQESLPGAPDWSQPLLQQLNEFMAQSGSALEKQITVGENLAAFYKDVTAQVPAESWVDIPYAAGWSSQTSDAPGRYLIDALGFVHCDGLVATSNTTTYPTLSSGMPRPVGASAGGRYFATWATNGATYIPGLWELYLDGGIRWAGGAGTAAAVSLYGVTYKAADALPQKFVGSGWPLNIQNQLGVRPQFVGVAQATDKDTLVPVSCGTPAWNLATNGAIQITHVPGLTPGRSYNLRLLVMA